MSKYQPCSSPMKKFEGFCEQLCKEWLEDRVTYSDFIADEFQTEYLPEPYLVFGTAHKPLYVLTTNPGVGEDFQERSKIIHGSDIIPTTKTYKDIAGKLAEHYQEKLDGAAKRRVDGFRNLAKKCNLDGVVQLESCPYHSKYLKKKNEFLSTIEHDDYLKVYCSLLRSALVNKSVITLSAVNTRKAITLESITTNYWLQWQADLIGFSIENAKLLPLSRKPPRITSTFIYSRVGDTCKGFILMMGGNNLPEARHLDSIAQAFGS